MKKTEKESKFGLYLKEKRRYSNSPAFYKDCAAYFFKQKKRALGLRILSNLMELDIENHQILRILGYRLIQEGFLIYVVHVL